MGAGNLTTRSTAGREVARAAQFVGVSFISAASNLLYILIFSHYTMMPFWLISFSSTEFSMLVSFVLNDTFTFKTLARDRAWYVRLVRFQAAAAGGNLLTAALSTFLYSGLAWHAIYAQAAAIVVAFFFNFTVHRFWTFRGKRTEHRAGTDVPTAKVRALRAYPIGVSVVVPVRNEMQTMRQLLKRLRDTLAALGLPYELLVIDDRSTDDTVKVAALAFQEYGIPGAVRLKVGRVGKSYSLIEGFDDARYSVLAMIDGDLELPPEALPDMIRGLNGYEMVVGKRLGYNVGNTTRARLSNAFNGVVVHGFLGLPYQSQVGIKVLKHFVYDALTIRPGRWSFDLELVAQANAYGFRITEQPVPFTKRQVGESKVRPVQVALDLLWTALRLKVRLTQITWRRRARSLTLHGRLRRLSGGEPALALEVLSAGTSPPLSADVRQNGTQTDPPVPRQTMERTSGHRGEARSLQLPNKTPFAALFAAYMGILTLVYSSVIFIPYGFADDYFELSEASHGTLWSSNLIVIAEGRPLAAVLEQLTFGPMGAIGDVRLLRLAAIVGLALFACLLSYALAAVRAPRYFAYALPLLVCMMPTWQVYVAWSVCASYPWAAVSCGLAFFLVERALDGRSIVVAGALLLLASLLILAAVTVYQPAAMAFWVFVAIPSIAGRDSLVKLCRRLIVSGAVMVAALGAEYVLAKELSVILFGPAGVARTQLVSDFGAKGTWFVDEALRNAFNLYNIVPSPLIALVVASATALGLFIYVHGTLGRRIFVALLCAILLPLSYLPNLVVKEDWAAYRTQAGLGSLAALYAGFALLGFLSVFNLTRLAARAVTVVAVAASMLAAAVSVTTAIAIPQYVELAVMRSQLQPSAVSRTSCIYLIPSTWEDTISTVSAYDEYGTPSSSESWSGPNMVYLILHDTDPSADSLPITLASTTSAPPKGCLVVDMRVLERCALTLGKRLACWMQYWRIPPLLAWPSFDKTALKEHRITLPAFG